MANFTVIYDANVLYPAPLRSILMYLGMTGMFRARWTMDIHEEWLRNLLIKREDLNRQQLEACRDMMISAIPDSLVTGYEPITETLELPDPDDRHVLAAAIRANAEVIVSNNLKDFPDEILDQYNCHAEHPDEFIANLMDLDHIIKTPYVNNEVYIRGLLNISLIAIELESGSGYCLIGK